MMRQRGYRAPRAMACMLLLLLLLGWLHGGAAAQEIEFHAPAAPADAQAMNTMRDLAQRILPVYQEKDPERYLGYLSALQLVAGDYAAADATRQSLAKRRQAPNAGPATRGAILYDIYVHARAIEARDRSSFETAFTQTYSIHSSHRLLRDAHLKAP